MKTRKTILGLETSCDETAAAVVQDDGMVLSSAIHSQAAIHHRYGGVVPELAGREHINNIMPVVAEALSRSGRPLASLSAIAVATHPGLLGALLVGVSFAKALAWSLRIPLVEVNHLKAHILSIFLSCPRLRFPFVALLVSGGHTSLYYVKSAADFLLIGSTRDDAAGEAFDKVAKYLGLDYPGGPIIERLASKGDPVSVSLPRSWISANSLDFSFSGLKTAVVNHLRTAHGFIRTDAGPDRPVLDETDLRNLAASFQEAIIDVLVVKTNRAAAIHGCRSIVVAGGVAANSALRKSFFERSDRMKIYFPPPALCTDNAIMIAAAAHPLFRNKCFAGLDADASPNKRLWPPGTILV